MSMFFKISHDLLDNFDKLWQYEKPTGIMGMILWGYGAGMRKTWKHHTDQQRRRAADACCSSYPYVSTCSRGHLLLS